MNRNDGTSCLAAVRQNLMRLEDYHADNLKSDHKEVMRLIQQACLAWGVELE